MTDPAPPARTPMTPEERARLFFVAYRPPDAQWYVDEVLRVGLTDTIREAETAARADGRLAGLEEAAQEAVRLSSWGGYSDAPNIARRIRGLAEDVPKAPKNQATPSDPDLR